MKENSLQGIGFALIVVGNIIFIISNKTSLFLSLIFVLIGAILWGIGSDVLSISR